MKASGFNSVVMRATMCKELASSIDNFAKGSVAYGVMITGFHEYFDFQ